MTTLGKTWRMGSGDGNIYPWVNILLIFSNPTSHYKCMQCIFKILISQFRELSLFIVHSKTWWCHCAGFKVTLHTTCHVYIVLYFRAFTYSKWSPVPYIINAYIESNAILLFVQSAIVLDFLMCLAPLQRLIYATFNMELNGRLFHQIVDR